MSHYRMFKDPEGGLPPPHDKGDPADKRQHPRASLGLLIQIRSDSIDEFRSVHCENISLGGMFLRTDQRRPLGSEIFFQFTLAGRGTLIEGLGQVVRVAPDGVGVKFISLLEPSASIIRHLVEDRLANEV